MLSLSVYRFSGCWCFDDETRGLHAEPFVLGMSEIIDFVISKNCEPGLDRYSILFSADPFPKSQGCLVRTEFELGGAWYYRETAEPLKDACYPVRVQQGWLCPATLKYFPKHPEKIFFRISALENN